MREGICSAPNSRILHPGRFRQGFERLDVLIVRRARVSLDAARFRAARALGRVVELPRVVRHCAGRADAGHTGRGNPVILALLAK